jgi:TonB-linked SusC/RagA family outer membrane protein
MTMRNSSKRSTRTATRHGAALGLTLVPGALVALVPDALAAQVAGAQTGRITGTVRGGGGEPVPGAQVSIPGTSLGAVSDAEGRFTIPGVPAGTHQLRAQRIGYAPSTQQVVVAADGTVTVDFGLTAIATTLQSVAVVGYTTQQRRDVSDATTTVTGSEIRDQKVATVEEALRGRVPGVQIAASGQPGRPAAIVIRGQNGFRNPSPLYIVDGMYIGQQNPNLNPDDIASIEVLKDASSAAQYGSQGANGVIVITTRKGSSGPSEISLNSYYGFQSVPRRIPVMGSAELQKVYLSAYQAAGKPPGDIPSGVTTPTNIDTDWQDALFQTGAIQNYNLQASGGTPTASYLLSGSFLDQQGTVINTNFRRYSVRANSEARRGRFTVGENLAVSQATQTAFPNGIFGGVALPLIDVVAFLPTIPVKDPNNPGGYGYGSDANPTFATNPIAALETNYNRFRSNQVLGTGYAQVALWKGLSYRLNLGINYRDSLATNWTSSTQLRYRTPVLGGATLSQAAPNSQQLMWENLLNYDGSFGGDQHRVNAVAGLTSQRNDYQQISAFRQGFSNEALQQINAGQAASSSNSGYLMPFRTNSVLARVNYAAFDRYLVTGSIRRDCSSRFSPDDRCGTFGAGSIGWVLSNEGFFKGIPFVGGADYLKLRASTGVLGDQNIGDLAYVVPITQNINYLLNGSIIPGATQLQLANTTIKWQRNRSSNIGLDLGVMNDALTFTADDYNNLADQLLVAAAIPTSLGSRTLNGNRDLVIYNPTVNAGKVRNAGFELGATHHLTRGDFRLNSTLNLTTTANRVVSLGNGGQPLFAGGISGLGIARTTVGQPIGEFFLKKTCGVFKTTAEIAAHPAQAGAQLGDLCYVDQNGDNRINDDDRVNAGSPIPKVTSGLFFDSKWKAWDVGLNFRGAWGNKVYNAIRLQTERTVGYHNLSSDFSPWSPENPNSNTPRAVYDDAVNGDPATDRWLESGSFVRFQNLIVGYTLPAGLFRGMGSAAARTQPRIYFNGQNLYTWTDYSGFDPEVLGFGDPLARGVDDGLIYPNPRTITIGLDLRF